MIYTQQSTQVLWNALLCYYLDMFREIKCMNWQKSGCLSMCTKEMLDDEVNPMVIKANLRYCVHGNWLGLKLKWEKFWIYTFSC